ncbi:MAG: gliding motility-associated C-terminal domain-containing protein, partial [Crocinitomicaceae bacterium]|nr:gliding motility-associated C-terminal domain-containing protein [Crocinitomicaceae bacterium]
SVTPDYTDICHSEVQFIDESAGGNHYFYWYDDSTIFSMGAEANPIHQYLFDGTHYPMQIVTNEWGCKDTAYNELYIEPFTLYIPNTFTPDGDEFNQSFQPFFSSGYDPYDFTMTIYNRWGEVVFVSHDVNAGWDGTYGGSREIQDGMYNWTIEVKTIANDERVSVQGHVTIIR